MNREEELQYYNKTYATSSEYRKEPEQSRYYPVWKTILNMLSKEETIIEVGCGSGQLAKLLIKNGFNYCFGFDYSHEAIEIARTINQQRQRFIVRDVYNIKKPLDADTVICTEVLEHLDDDFHVINILSPGTRFIFSVPNFWYKTHKRVFADSSQIAQRYNQLKINNVFGIHTPAGNIIHLVDSVKM